MKNIKQLVSEAIENKNKIRFSYTDAEGKKTTRTVCPLVLFRYDKSREERRYYLMAFCELDFDYRTFRLDRIRNIRTLSEVFKPEELSDIDFNEKLQTVFIRKRVNVIKSTLRKVEVEKDSINQVKSPLPPTVSTEVYGSVNENIEIENNIYGNFNDDYPKEWYSPKVKGHFCLCRSPLEEIEFMKLDKDDEVVAYEVEPFKIRYYAGSQIKYYIPDLLVTYKNGRHVIAEIKTLSDIRLEKNQAKFKAIEQYAEEHGYEFEVWARRGIGRLTSGIFDVSDEGNYASWEKAVWVAESRIKKNEVRRQKEQFWNKWGCLVWVVIAIVFLVIFLLLRY